MSGDFYKRTEFWLFMKEYIHHAFYHLIKSNYMYILLTQTVKAAESFKSRYGSVIENGRPKCF